MKHRFFGPFHVYRGRAYGKRYLIMDVWRLSLQFWLCDDLIPVRESRRFHKR